jgi:hypothetical protein
MLNAQGTQCQGFPGKILEKGHRPRWEPSFDPRTEGQGPHTRWCWPLEPEGSLFQTRASGSCLIRVTTSCSLPPSYWPPTPLCRSTPGRASENNACLNCSIFMCRALLFLFCSIIFFSSVQKYNVFQLSVTILYLWYVDHQCLYLFA